MRFFFYRKWAPFVVLYALVLFPVAVLSQGSQALAKEPREKVKPTSELSQEPSAPSSAPEKKAAESEEEDFETLLKKELEGGTESAASQKREEISWGWQILKTLLVLIFLIGIFWFGWKLYLFRKRLPLGESEVMQVLYSHNLLAGRQIQIVQLGGRLLVLGISDSGVQLITEISDRNTIDQIKMDCEKARKSEKPDFLWELTKTIKEKVSNWTNPQKNLSKHILPSDVQNWGELRKRSQTKIKDLKKQKNFFNEQWGENEL